MSILKRAIFRTIAIEALIAANTLAGPNVFLYAWPLNNKIPAAIRVNWGLDTKMSNGRTVANFTSTFTLRLDVTVRDVTMIAANEKLDILLSQIEQAILTNYQLNLQTQQFPHFHTVNTTDADNEDFIASAICDIGFETFELFEPCVNTSLETITVDVDLQNVFDPTGTYPNPAFPGAVQPAPRNQGPDGRSEGIVRADNIDT